MSEFYVAMMAMACAVICVIMSAWVLGRFSRLNYRISKLTIRINDMRDRMDLLQELTDKLVDMFMLEDDDEDNA